MYIYVYICLSPYMPRSWADILCILYTLHCDACLPSLVCWVGVSVVILKFNQLSISIYHSPLFNNH